MSSQIPCKDLDRENTNLIDEEVHLMADLNSAGDRTDLGIPGMRKFSVISCQWQPANPKAVRIGQ